MSNVAERYTKTSSSSGTKPKGTLRYSLSEFRALWTDRKLSSGEIGQRIGFCQTRACKLAKSMNLPAKRRGGPSKVDDDVLRVLWDAELSSSEIGLHFHCDKVAVLRAADRLGLAKRNRGFRPAMTLAQYRDTLLAKAMACDAAAEQRQMILAEMADCIGTVRPVGAEKGRAA